MDGNNSRNSGWQVRAAVAGALASLLVTPVGIALQQGPVIEQDAAEQFIMEYYTKITDSASFEDTYLAKVTLGYRSYPNRDLEAARIWYSGVAHVEVGLVRPSSGNDNEYLIPLTFAMKDAARPADTSEYIFSLKCTNRAARFPGIYSCGSDDIQIDLVVPIGEG